MMNLSFSFLSGKGASKVKEFREKREFNGQVERWSINEKLVLTFFQIISTLKSIHHVVQVVHLNDVRLHRFRIFLFVHCFISGISMRGQKDDVLRCLTEVYSVLDGAPPRGPIRYYDPSTYNGYNVIEYGGYAENSMTNHQHNFRANHNVGYVNHPYVN